jgi:hypothetical protein
MREGIAGAAGKILAPVTLREAVPTSHGELSAGSGPGPVDPHSRSPTLCYLAIARTRWQLRAQHLVATCTSVPSFRLAVCFAPEPSSLPRLSESELSKASGLIANKIMIKSSRHAPPCRSSELILLTLRREVMVSCMDASPPRTLIGNKIVGCVELCETHLSTASTERMRDPALDIANWCVATHPTPGFSAVHQVHRIVGCVELCETHKSTSCCIDGINERFGPECSTFGAS